MQPWWLVSGMSDEWVVQDGHLFIGGEKIEDQNG
jgi:hypothetical protein